MDENAVALEEDRVAPPEAKPPQSVPVETIEETTPTVTTEKKKPNKILIAIVALALILAILIPVLVSNGGKVNQAEYLDYLEAVMIPPTRY